MLVKLTPSQLWLCMIKNSCRLICKLCGADCTSINIRLLKLNSEDRKVFVQYILLLMPVQLILILFDCAVDFTGAAIRLAQAPNVSRP